MLSYYQILQVNENASEDEIKKAYRKLCKILHPDLHNNTKESNVIFNLLHEAYETLSDKNKRLNYNPNKQKVTNVSSDSSEYNTIISGYKNILSDYKKIIHKKEKREKELLIEIKNLKEKINTEITIEKEVNQKPHDEKEDQKTEIIPSQKKVKFDLLYYAVITAIFSALIIFIYFLLTEPVMVIFLILLGYCIKVFFHFFNPFKGDY